MVTDRTSSSIVIAVRRQDVMAVIADFASYPKWASAVRSADVLANGPDGHGSRVRFRLDAGPVKDSYVLGYTWDGDAAVHWDLVEPGSVVCEMSGAYLLAEHGEGTQVTYELEVGLRVPMIGMIKRRAEKMIVDTALKGLKTRAEAEGRQA